MRLRRKTPTAAILAIAGSLALLAMTTGRPRAHELVPPKSDDRLIHFSPSCPSSHDPVIAYATNPGRVLSAEPLSVAITGLTIKVVVEGAHSGWITPPGSAAVATIPALDPGLYGVEVYTRTRGNELTPDIPIGTLGPEEFTGRAPLEVFSTPPTCDATHAVLVGSSFGIAVVDEPYAHSLQARLLDFHGHHVANGKVRLDRVTPPAELASPVPHFPDSATAPGELISDAEGKVRWSLRANSNPGTFQYAMYLSEPTPFTRNAPLAYFTLYNAPQSSSQPTYPVVEYVRWVAGGPHYFMTGHEAEMSKLDASALWTRTGGVFMAFPPGSRRPDTTPVCRFYGLPSAGLDSHFYSASIAECASVAARFAGKWQLETDNAFEVYAPQPSGACPYQTQPLHRAFNNKTDANHRYFASNFLAPQGWTVEGYGADQVVMCLPR